MMTKQTEALKMAIEALDESMPLVFGNGIALEIMKTPLLEVERKVNFHKKAIQACKEALEQPSVAELNDEYLRDTHVEGLQPAQNTITNVTLSCGCKSSELGFPSEWDGETRECEPCTNYGVLCMEHFYKWNARPAQTHPAPEWAGLTDDEIAEGVSQSWVDKQAFESACWWAEQKLKEKNTITRTSSIC